MQQPWAAQSAAAAAGEPTAGQAAPAAAAAPLPPWTPTRELQKRKTLPKRMQHLLTVSAVKGQQNLPSRDCRQYNSSGCLPPVMLVAAARRCRLLAVAAC